MRSAPLHLLYENTLEVADTQEEQCGADPHLILVIPELLIGTIVIPLRQSLD